MTIYKDKIYDEERALYGSVGISVENCRFDGPVDGESAMKESRDVMVKSSFFNLRYPFWHNHHLQIEDSDMTEKCRAAIWYSDDIRITNTRMHGIKGLRECCDVEIEGCNIISPEFGWSVTNISMKNSFAESEYFMMRSTGLQFESIRMKGKYSFQYIEDAVFDNCSFDTKDAFWHAKNVVVRNCRVKGEYLGWYCENVTFENCTLIGTQPLCYCKGLKLIDCRMKEADLAFEKSDVDADILSSVISIKNPRSGSIRVKSVEEIIMDDKDAKCDIITTGSMGDSKEKDSKETDSLVTGTNPILKMDYPDPDVIRVGNTFYMVSTTMHFMPGAEILKSHDLINWEHATFVYDKLDSTDGQRLVGNKHIYGKGMWAACIRFHEGAFYILFVCNDTQKTYLYKSENVFEIINKAGKECALKADKPDDHIDDLDLSSLSWTKSIVEGFYHDASLLFDEGKIYIVYGNTDIYLTELNSELSGPEPGGKNGIILSDKGNPMLGYEGSHLYKINGRYYLFLIHSKRDRWRRVEACFMADSIDEFLSDSPDRKVIGGDVFDDDMDFRNSGIAQGGIVEGPDGVWNAILFQDSGAIGRLPVLVPVTFREDGYPVFGINGRAPKNLHLPVLKTGVKYNNQGKILVESRGNHEYLDAAKDRESLIGNDDFRYNPEETIKRDKKNYGSFGFKSMWQFNHEPDMKLVKCDAEEGCFWITTDKLSSNIYFARNTLTQRMRFPRCSAEVTLDVSRLKDGDSAGLAAFQGNYAWVGVQKNGGKNRAVMCTFTNTSGDIWNLSEEPGVIQESFEFEGDTIRLRLSAVFEQDTTVCEVDLGQGFRQIGSEHQLSFRLDHFTGCRFGLFVYSEKETGGSAGFMDFRYN